MKLHWVLLLALCSSCHQMLIRADNDIIDLDFHENNADSATIDENVTEDIAEISSSEDTTLMEKQDIPETEETNSDENKNIQNTESNEESNQVQQQEKEKDEEINDVLDEHSNNINDNDINNEIEQDDEENENFENLDLEDDAMKEIMELQQSEAEELAEKERQLEEDRIAIKKAEKMAKEQEEQEKKEQQQKRSEQFGSYTTASASSGGSSNSVESMEQRAQKRRSAWSSAGKKSLETDNGKNTNSKENAGSYYSSGSIDSTDSLKNPNTQSKTQNKESITSGDPPSRLSSSAKMSNNVYRGLEERLGIDLKSRLASQTLQQKQKDEILKRRMRFILGRRYEAPVEKVLRVYRDQKTDIYQILNVPRSVSDTKLKKVYRSIALKVHPDKNPHPDAKLAFDIVQDAFATLASPIRRAEYDMQLKKVERARRPTPRRVKKWFNDFLFNQKSKMELFWYRLRNGKMNEEWAEMTSGLKETSTNFHHFLEHIVLLPTLQDRIMFHHEIFCRNFFRIFNPLFLVSLVY